MLWVLASLMLSQTPEVPRALVANILFPAGAPAGCTDGTLDEQNRCLIAARYEKDAASAKVALNLYARTSTVAGVLPEQDFDGAYRGKLHLVPRVAVGANRKHLEYASAALLDFDWFFESLKSEPKFRWRRLALRFFESVKRRTPSAFANDWTVSYNVAGSLFTSEAAVRATLFHEVFHLNDFDHDGWSTRALGFHYAQIVAKCGTKTECLKPYAPDSIIVIGGTYYAFMPDNGVVEYAADLARRYYVEQRAMLKHEKLGAPPFKCGNELNAKTWKLLVDEFFGGVDLTPACK